MIQKENIKLKFLQEEITLLKSKKEIINTENVNIKDEVQRVEKEKTQENFVIVEANKINTIQKHLNYITESSIKQEIGVMASIKKAMKI